MQATGGWKLRHTDTLLGCGLSLHAGTWWVLCWVSGELRHELGLMLFEKGNRCGQCWLPFPIFSWENLGSMLWFAREKKHWSCRYVCTVCLLIAFFESYGKSWNTVETSHIYIRDELEYNKMCGNTTWEETQILLFALSALRRSGLFWISLYLLENFSSEITTWWGWRSG